MNPPKKAIAILGKISGRHFPGAGTEKMGQGRVGSSCLHLGRGSRGKQGGNHHRGHLEPSCLGHRLAPSTPEKRHSLRSNMLYLSIAKWPT